MAILSYTCFDCGSGEAAFTDTAFYVTHDPDCPVLRDGRLSYLANQDVYAAATLNREARGLVADYGSAEVRHVGLR